ncbi:MAG TPA: lipopolysaccharide biosynthesis protein [Hyphomicrobium sp.]|jgi:O-antigen/teichoic acid export membrane protein
MSKLKAAVASAWSAADILLRQVVQFVISLVLARLVSPTDFGLLALLTLFTRLSMVFVESGMSVALIRLPETSIKLESSVFWFNLILACVCAACLALLSPYASRFYQEPALQPLMLAAAAQVVVGSLGSVQNALLVRGLRFRELLIVGALATGMSGALGILLARSGFGVWALAWQSLAMTATTTLGLWIVGGWRPRFSFDIHDVQSLFGFSGRLVVSSILDMTYSQGLVAIVGKLYGVAELGFFNRGSGVQSLVGGMLTSVISRVTFPMFSTRTNDKAALRRGVGLALGATMAINVPAMVGLSVLSDLVISALFGPSWGASAPILAVLAISGILWPVHVINLQLVLARGDSQTFLRLEVIKQFQGIITMVIGSYFGIMGLAWSQVASAIIAAFINAAPTQKSLDYGFPAQMIDLSRIFIVAAGMGGVLICLRDLLPTYSSSPLRLIVLIFAGGSFYIGAALLLRISVVMEILAILRTMLTKRNGALT